MGDVRKALEAVLARPVTDAELSRAYGWGTRPVVSSAAGSVPSRGRSTPTRRWPWWSCGSSPA